MTRDVKLSVPAAGDRPWVVLAGLRGFGTWTSAGPQDIEQVDEAVASLDQVADDASAVGPETR